MWLGENTHAEGKLSSESNNNERLGGTGRGYLLFPLITFIYALGGTLDLILLSPIFSASPISP